MANLAEIYDEADDDITAVRYAREALGYLSGNNMPFMGTASNLATYYTNLNRIDSAFYFINLSDSVARLTHNLVQEHVHDRLITLIFYLRRKNLTKQKKRSIL